MADLTSEPLGAEQAQRHAEFGAATTADGRVGEAANAVARRLYPHLQREEEFALPPLALLGALGRGAVEPGVADVPVLGDKQAAGLPDMLVEHEAIGAALREREPAADAAQNPKQTRSAGMLIQNAGTEEEGLYPAALAIGRFVRLSLGAGQTANNPDPQEKLK